MTRYILSNPNVQIAPPGGQTAMTDPGNQLETLRYITAELRTRGCNDLADPLNEATDWLVAQLQAHTKVVEAVCKLGISHEISQDDWTVIISNYEAVKDALDELDNLNAD